MPITKKRVISKDAPLQALLPQNPQPVESSNIDLIGAMQDLVIAIATREKPKAPKSLTAKVDSRIAMSDGTTRISEVSIVDNGKTVMAIKVITRDNMARIKDVEITNFGA